MALGVPIKQLVSLELSSDGRLFLITAEMQTGEKASFSISFQNAYWLAQNVLRLSRAATERQKASGQILGLSNDLDTLVVEDYDVSIKPNIPQVLATVLGHWEGSVDAGGAIALLLDRQKVMDLAKELFEAVDMLAQISRPS